MNTSPFPAVPRIESLHHRLKTAKDSAGEPLPLLDELMVFLEDPPPGVGDRWQAGADLCVEHGVPTSRMSVWRFYRAHVLQWRHEQDLPLDPDSEESASQILGQTRQVLALRALESLRHPNLPPRVLIGLVQNENRRQELELARDIFHDQLETRRRLERKKELRRIRRRSPLPRHVSVPFEFHAGPGRGVHPIRRHRKKCPKKSPRPASAVPRHNTP